MSTDASYDLGIMLPGVLDNALNGGLCRSCHRATNDMVIGHDGYCPVPALTKAIARIADARDLLDADLVECVHKRGYFECGCAKSAVVPHCQHCLYPKWMHDVAAALTGPEGVTRTAPADASDDLYPSAERTDRGPEGGPR